METATAITLPFRLALVDSERREIVAVEGTEGVTLSNVLLRAGKLETLSGKAAASITMGLLTISFTGRPKREHSMPELLAEVQERLAPKVAAWQEVEKATAAFAEMPDLDNAKWLENAAAEYRAVYWGGMVVPVQNGADYGR